ncbi:MAG: hypothetical protein IPH62_18115 [Ignavibacteriae bacterium]|nr:hypothetical protein [Ignavibacteriota bacterium]
MGEIWIYSLIISIPILVYLVYKGSKTNVNQVKYGDYEGRIKHFTVKIALNPNDSCAYYERGMSYLKSQNKKAALQDLKMAASLGDTRAYDIIDQNNLEGIFLQHYTRDARLNNEINYNKQDDYKGSIEDFDKVLKSNPQNSTAYFMRAEIKEIYKDHAGALDDLNNALKINNKYAIAYYKRGEVKIKLNDIDGAKLDLKTSVALGYNKASKLLTKIE